LPSFTIVDPGSDSWYRRISISSEQLLSELKVDEGRYVKGRKFYDKIRGR